jgi:hypothetical protein
MKRQVTEFVVLGTVVVDEATGRKRVLAKSDRYLRGSLDRLNVGDEVVVTYSTRKPTFSQGQRNLHFALMGYLAEYSGHSVAEMHEYVMREKFGTKRIALGDKIQEVRRSLSDTAKMPKDEMGELLDFDFELCKSLGIEVPTAEELGYVSNY